MRYLRRAIQEDDEDAYPKYNLCDIGARYMKLLLMNGKSDFSLLAQARTIEKGFAKQGRHDYGLYSYVGQAVIPKLAFDIAQGDASSVSADVKEAMGYFATSLAENPKFPETEPTETEPSTQAKLAMTQALAINPLLRREYAPLIKLLGL